MQAIVVVKIGAFKSLMERDGITKTVQSATQFVAKARGILGNQVFDIRGDMVLATTSSVSRARTLSDSLRYIHPNTSIVIGYGDLYKTVDGIYWGPEIEEAIRMIVCNGIPGEVLLTSNARIQQ